MCVKDKRPTAVSLFSGAGGMDTGFTKAGWNVVFSNEMDSDAANSYCSNPTYLDASAMHPGDINQYLDGMNAYKGADLVFGGPPCQGFSVAGKMDPADSRSNLVFTFLDVVSRVHPRLFVMENVKALATLAKWKDVRSRLVNEAEAMGYGCCFLVLNATDYGVPQSRERMFFVGARGLSPYEVHSLVSDGLNTHKAPADTVRNVLSRLPEYGSVSNPATSIAEITLAKNPILRKSAYHGSLLFNGRGRPIDLDSTAKTLPAQMGGNHTPIINQLLLDDPSAVDWITLYHEALLGGKTTPSKEKVPPELRRLTVREAALLQTFPDDFTFSGPVGKQYRQVGNAVPCLLAEAVARAVIEKLLPRVIDEVS